MVNNNYGFHIVVTHLKVPNLNPDYSGSSLHKGVSHGNRSEGLDKDLARLKNLQRINMASQCLN